MESRDGFEPPHNRVAACSLSQTWVSTHMARPLRIEHRSQGFGGLNASSYTIAAYWWTNKDLNLEPFGYEPNALTIVLLVHVVPRVRIELTATRSSAERSIC